MNAEAGENKITVLLVEPGKKPYAKKIENTLHALQHEVGGYIEVVYPYEDMVALVCHDEGKLEGMPLNRALRDSEGHIYDVVAGTFFITGLSQDDFSSLSDDLLQKYANLFHQPEMFIQINGKIVVLPMEEYEEKPNAFKSKPLSESIQAAVSQASNPISESHMNGPEQKFER